MKLIRFGEVGREKPGLQLEDGRRVDTSPVTGDYDEAFFENGGLEKLKSASVEGLPELPVGTRLGPCIARPSKIICVGLNYHKHAEESGMDAPAEPVLFFKSTTALCGPNDPVLIPPGAQKVDWEVELAVVIGKTARYVERAQAMDYVAGYSLHNDYSEREYQLERGGQWVKGKSCDSFAPLGPWLATRDEIMDPAKLDLWLKVNGEQLQSSSTADMIFPVDELVSYISRFMTLLPGDVISTGTPQGVGLGFDPPRYLKEGDVVSLGASGLGESSQKAKQR